jgi:SnoaL-like domain
MSDPTTVVRTYIDMWNETDPERRRELVAEALTDDARYVDPIMAGNGTDEISAMIGVAQEQYPGHRFELVAGPDVHHDRVRFTWTLGSPDGQPIATGIDFATTADDGRMRDVTGFLEPPA